MKAVEADTEQRPAQERIERHLLDAEIAHRLVLDVDTANLRAAAIDAVLEHGVVAQPAAADRSNRDGGGEVEGQHDRDGCADGGKTKHATRTPRAPAGDEHGDGDAGDRVA